MKYIVVLALLAITGCTTFTPPENLYRIQSSINHKWTAVTDKVKWGVDQHDEGEVTGDVPFASDCEEYAAAARYQLRKAGISADRWLVIGQTGKAHAVTCTTDGWCLDNMHRMPVKRDALGYQWLMII